MSYNPSNPLIVQSDKTILLEVDNPSYAECRDRLAAFAELEKSPEHIHTYRISPLSLWNASASGKTFEEVKSCLVEYSKFDVPPNIIEDVRDYMGRYGRLKLIKEGERLILISDDVYLIAEIMHSKQVRPFLSSQLDERRIEIDPALRGRVKQELIRIGFPVEDLAGYVAGDEFNFALRSRTLSGSEFTFREYQEAACSTFWAGGGVDGGSGVLVLPCGAGKTVIGIGAMLRAQTSTLILVTGITAARQWKAEILDKTNIPDEAIGEYSGEQKGIRPITIATYQVMTYRKRSKEDQKGEFPHLKLFDAQNWGLIVYDEVHLLPAPVFRVTAEIQAKRRLGLTATLVREDRCESDVFSLIGPKKYDVPWKVLERQGWIAEALCTEVRIPLDESKRWLYATCESRDKFRIASENPGKLDIVRKLVERHQDDNILVIGQYIDQLEEIARLLKVPIITGKTSNAEREALYADFRSGAVKLLVVSKVANFAIDLPDASVAIQISGTFGSRQEEAQRLGRILRRKPDGRLAHFYSIVTKESKDQEFAANRQLFLTEQGYRYEIMDGTALDEPAQTTS